VPAAHTILFWRRWRGTWFIGLICVPGWRVRVHRPQDFRLQPRSLSLFWHLRGAADRIAGGTISAESWSRVIAADLLINYGKSSTICSLKAGILAIVRCGRSNVSAFKS
jgi:hypothetical protein